MPPVSLDESRALVNPHDSIRSENALVELDSAATDCKEPTLPTMPNGRTAPAADIIAAANAVKAYVVDSDVYQQCLKYHIDSIDLSAFAFISIFDMTAKGDANQARKEQLGASYAAVAAAYRSAHPQPARAR